MTSPQSTEIAKIASAPEANDSSNFSVGTLFSDAYNKGKALVSEHPNEVAGALLTPACIALATAAAVYVTKGRNLAGLAEGVIEGEAAPILSRDVSLLSERSFASSLSREEELLVPRSLGAPVEPLGHPPHFDMEHEELVGQQGEVPTDNSSMSYAKFKRDFGVTLERVTHNAGAGARSISEVPQPADIVFDPDGKNVTIRATHNFFKHLLEDSDPEKPLFKTTQLEPFGVHQDTTAKAATAAAETAGLRFPKFHLNPTGIYDMERLAALRGRMLASTPKQLLTDPGGSMGELYKAPIEKLP